MLAESKDLANAAAEEGAKTRHGLGAAEAERSHGNPVRAARIWGDR